MLILVMVLMLLCLAGAGMLFVGLRGLLAGRATIYSGKWLFALIALCFLPQFINGLKLLTSVPSMAIINIVLYPFLLLVFWFATKGHICFGISEETANDALNGAFEKLGLKHEKALGSVRAEDGGIFQISIQDWVGTMQIKPKNREAKARMAGLVAALSDHFSASTAKIRYLPYWIYALCGGLLLASLLVLAGLLLGRPHKNMVPPEQPAQGQRTVRQNIAPFYFG
ncbi:MAG: hypothetical protein Q7R35_11505 [Elusimicrobiota bacterium]|nr:hypothetical protein [Elusimicrobiota bacterium]